MRDRLARIEGVGDAQVFGARDYAMRIWLDPERIAARGLTAADVEDQPGGVSGDIWFAKDLNQDGDLTDPREGIGRWASNGTSGSELTGLYFDPTDKRRAWVNIQHPSSGNDRTIEITVE